MTQSSQSRWGGGADNRVRGDGLRERQTQRRVSQLEHQIALEIEVCRERNKGRMRKRVKESSILNAMIKGVEPYGFHAVNVGLHAAVTALFTYIELAIIQWDFETALYGGLLFATHPIHTEAVAGIVGRADVLTGLLLLLSFLSYTRAIHNSQQTSECDISRGTMWLITSLVLATGAMLAKEHGVTVLGIVLCYDFYASKKGLRKLVDFQHLNKDQVNLIKRSLTIISMVAFLLGFRMSMLNGALPRFSEQDNPASFSPHPMTRLLTYSYLLVFNAWLMLAPVNLSYDWQMGSIPLLHSFSDIRNLATGIFFLTLVALTRRAILTDCVSSDTGDRNGRAMILAMLFLVVPFLPASNLFFSVGFVVAERVLYVPSVGMCLLITHGFSNLMDSFPKRRSILRCLMLLLIALFLIKTVQRNKVWHSRQTLFQSGLDALPHNAKMHYNYANLQKDLGNVNEAIEHYQTTLRLWPDHASAHNNLGTLLEDPTEAKMHFMEAIRINPLHPRAHFNMGNLLSKKGQLPTAIRFMERAVQLDHTYSDAYTNLAAMYSEVGRHHDAEQLHKTLLSMDKDNPDVHNNYGAFLQKLGRTEEALISYKEAVELQANHTVALVNAAKLLRSLKRNSEAELLYQRTLSVNDDPKVRDHLGILYLNTGRVVEARETYELLTSQYPDELEAKIHFAQVMLHEQHLRDAENMLLSVVQMNETQRDALRQLALLYSHENRTTEALEYILRALKACHNNDTTCAQLHAEHANILKDMDDMDTAAESYKMAVQVNPSFTLAHLNLGVIYHIKRDFKQAWKYYRTAQLLEPHNRLLLENMEKLRRAEMAFLRLQVKDAPASDSCR
uniref:dolichyl-phosphate-mannose--protein mannosyltransferase n=1 Tax=Strigamia maritima TaxID=126957 RepID=T1J4S4_STRMM